MISIFRKIRQKLLRESKVTRYLAYAIGEIVLVVIGILIALQVNTWNENRNNQKKETGILKDLHQEFQLNKASIDASIQQHQTILEAIKGILNLMGQDNPELSENQIDSLINMSLEYDNYSPSQSVIAELISSGKTSLISSDTLRTLIFEWVQEIEDKNEGYQSLDVVSENLLLPYLTKNGSMKNIDSNGMLKGIGRSRLSSSNLALVQEAEFENHMDNQAWGITNYLLKLEKLREIIEAILYHTQAETP
ncbi:hypothetical protein DFQ04_1677 [Algoriphagus boseongensis]|uniref:Uncharacterized protein n=1 Tax=Algoriphagus boseongensis TaxID=1442587 RepID=A0A4R6T4W8_9BACT|nr:DUF6090 family protein [Algoriphagus boseongensis]TDQ17029.1 hypothetical protein DFQ04_1677 [Algoriphagus boseongensis]